MANEQTRYAILEIHMEVGEFKIKYYDRATKLVYVVEGSTSVLPKEVFEALAPDFDQIVELIVQADLQGPEFYLDRGTPIQTVGEPYPEAVAGT